MNLRDKKIWIVGSTGAIGEVVQSRFLNYGALPFTDRVDVCNETEVKEMAEILKPEILINCSGILGPVGPVLSESSKDWFKTIEVNLIGSYNLTKSVLPWMLYRGGGKIIHFSGGGAAYGKPYCTAYGASKAALVRFVESVAMELGDRVQINAIAPGNVKSRMNPEATEDGNIAADLALWLASDKSGTITGRLISAIHDGWSSLETRTLSDEEGRLRRVPFIA